MNQGKSERLMEYERQFEQRIERGNRRRLRPGGQMYGFRGTLHVIWYMLLTAAAVSAVYHLVIT